MASSSTITLLQVLQYCEPWVNNIPLTVSTTTGPGLDICNQVAQTILAPPFCWRWNRNTTGFVCVAGQQDYVVGNRQNNTAYAVGFSTIDSNGNSQKVTTAGTTAGVPPTWSTSGTTVDGSVTWTFQSAIANSTSNFSYWQTENVQVYDPTATKWTQIENKIDLSLDSSRSRPMNCSAQYDDGQGNLTFRLMPIPDKAYVVSITSQKKFTGFTSLNNTWAPIPDEYASIYRNGVLALAYNYDDDLANFTAWNNKFMSGLIGQYVGMDQSQKDIFLQQYLTYPRQMDAAGATLQLGIRGRIL